MKKYFIIMIAAFAAVLGCERKPELVGVDELGCINARGESCTVDSVGYVAGTYALHVLSNGDFTVEIPSDIDWLRFSGKDDKVATFNGDCYVELAFDINRSIPRSAFLTLKKGLNHIVFELCQKGLLQGGLDIEEKNVAVAAEGGESGAKVTTKMKPEDFTFSVKYEGQETGWISNVRLQNNFICFNLQPNFSKTQMRHALIEAVYRGGKGVIYVSQFNVGSQVDNLEIDEFKALFPDTGTFTPDKHYLVSGQVINDNAELNGAENRLSSIDAPDMTYSERIVYIQNEDGTSGIKLVFSESAAALVSPYDYVSIDTYGLKIVHSADPDAYEIVDLPLSAAIRSYRGLEPQARAVSMSSLTDKDLYTRVTLKDVEIPVRKGNYLPIDIRYYMTVLVYPMVLRDAGGNSLHMMVNANCKWSRDGNAMPSGSGDVTGVLVHEPCDNYEWDTEKEKEMMAQGRIPDYIFGIGYPAGRINGNPCPYQIRPCRHSDLRVATEVENGFDALLCEWRYCDSLGVNLVKNYSHNENVLYPTYPAVADPMTLDAKFYCVDKNGKNVEFRLCNDFTHLGPYNYAGKITMPTNGNGVYDFLGRSAHWNVWGSTSTIGVIYSNINSNVTDWTVSNGSAWCVQGWSVNQYWCAEFSTADLSSANTLNVTFGTMNHIDAVGAPRYWAVEYSFDRSNWKRVQEYTVPDFTYSSGRRPWQLPGTKYVTATLPEAVAGAETVYVRLVPARTSAGNASSYDSASINSSRYNAINYFAVRYKK